MDRIPRDQYLLFFQLLIKTIEGEKKIEIARKTLCSNSFFEPYDLFKILDKERKNFLTAIDIFVFIKKYFSAIRKTSIDYVFRVMSKGGDVITYDLFASLITPTDYNKPFRTVYYLNKDSLHITPEITDAAAIDFCNLVQCIHDEYLNVDRCCNQLQNLGFTGIDAYELLEKDDKGYLDVEDIKSSLEPYFHYLGSIFSLR